MLLPKNKLSIFSRIYERISSHLGYHPLKHILNTIGIICFPEYQFDMVRLGIGLYALAKGAVSH